MLVTIMLTLVVYGSFRMEFVKELKMRLFSRDPQSPWAASLITT